MFTIFVNVLDDDIAFDQLSGPTTIDSGSLILSDHIIRDYGIALFAKDPEVPVSLNRIAVDRNCWNLVASNASRIISDYNIVFDGHVRSCIGHNTRSIITAVVIHKCVACYRSRRILFKEEEASEVITYTVIAYDIVIEDKIRYSLAVQNATVLSSAARNAIVPDHHRRGDTKYSTPSLDCRIVREGIPLDDGRGMTAVDPSTVICCIAVDGIVADGGAAEGIAKYPAAILIRRIQEGP